MEITTEIAAEVIAGITIKITAEVAIKVINRTELKPNYSSGNP